MGSITLQTLKGKTALITGAATGIGKEIALALASKGANIAIHYNNTPPDDTLKEIHQFGTRYISIHADFNKGINAAIKLYQETLRTLGEINILINNAAVLHSGHINEINEELYDETFLINTKIPYFLCKEAIKSMGKGGRIINLSSGGTKMILPHFSTYLSSKAALEQITRSLTVEAAEKSITINAIAAGATKTKMVSCFSETDLDALAKLTPLKRLGEPADIAKVVAFLASEEAAWITGQVICANGGLI